ncbi:unnamed protein product [Callosobruchus maculatus]|uniref:Protein Wnt n=1 Tax=Callosobruchus maculatus TaxID=64391 RepID=A0A653DS79_CALMS|nr:unnamed protein product [Callosobruchus maculatus]
MVYSWLVAVCSPGKIKACISLILNIWCLLQIGSLGTSGRPCNRTSPDIDGCTILCCGRGYNTVRTTVRERCHCKFQWCCKVECKTCIRSTDIHTCK